MFLSLLMTSSRYGQVQNKSDLNKKHPSIKFKLKYSQKLNS